MHLTVLGPRATLSTLSKESELDYLQRYKPSILRHLDSFCQLPFALVGLRSPTWRQAPEARMFYETEALRSGWSVRQLDRQIGSQFYERIALSQNKAAMPEKAETPQPNDAVTPEEAIKDPFVLEFLDLKDEYSESDLEEALILRLTDFLLELGDDFAFLGRQRRLLHRRHMVSHRPRLFDRRLRGLVIVGSKGR